MRALKKTILWLLGVVLCTAAIVGGVLGFAYFKTDAGDAEIPAVTAGGLPVAVNGYEWHIPVMGGILYRESSAPETLRVPELSQQPWTEKEISVILPEKALSHLTVLNDENNPVADVNNEAQVTVRFPANGVYTLKAEVRVPEKAENGQSSGPRRGYGSFRYTAKITVAVPPKAEFSAEEIRQGDVLTVLLTGFPDESTPVIETELGAACFCDVPEGKAAFIGIHYNREPGIWPVRVQCGNLDITQEIRVLHRDFPKQEISGRDPLYDASRASDAADMEWRNAIFPVYDAAEPQIYWNGVFVRPCETDAKFTEYGLYRYKNGSGRPSRSAGIDYACRAGDPVWAPARGKVLFAQPLALTGNTVVIEHGGGLKSYFYYLDTVSCTAGDFVGQKDVIGTAGSTGCAAAPHLHYEARIGNQSVDPELLFSGRSGLYFAS